MAVAVDPELTPSLEEVRETEAKAGAVWRALELACSQGDWA